VRGALAGPCVALDVEVVEASEERFVLVADGPISISVQYLLDPAADGTEVRTSVSVEEQASYSPERSAQCSPPAH
jgi:hypothetical protein